MMLNRFLLAALLGFCGKPDPVDLRLEDIKVAWGRLEHDGLPYGMPAKDCPPPPGNRWAFLAQGLSVDNGARFIPYVGFDTYAEPFARAPEHAPGAFIRTSYFVTLWAAPDYWAHIQRGDYVRILATRQYFDMAPNGERVLRGYCGFETFALRDCSPPAARSP